MYDHKKSNTNTVNGFLPLHILLCNINLLRLLAGYRLARAFTIHHISISLMNWIQ